MTVYCMRQWWPPQESLSAAVNFLIFLSLSGSSLYHFISAIYEGPGYLPLKWHPVSYKKPILPFYNNNNNKFPGK